MPASNSTPATDGGYKNGFLSSGISIGFPKLNTEQKKDIVTFNGSNTRLDFIHFSAVMCKSRRLAYFTAVNIDGKNWQDNSRSGSFKNDGRINGDEQLGSSLYSAKKSDFDKGHLVRREDPEWGDKQLSLKAGANTFWYTNCAPQHKKLNQEIWADLEANILHTGAAGEKLRCSVFTGPVLSPTDGTFVTKVGGQDIKIPSLFWKVVVWAKSDGKTYAVGFIQSQEKFLLEGGIITKPMVMNLSRLKAITDEDIFEHLKFKDGKTYQVKIEEIEKQSGLKFDWPGVIRPFKKATPKAITGVPVPAAKIKSTRMLIADQPGALKMVRTVNLRGLELG
jgi:endonuclease G, mitochondrial